MSTPAVHVAEAGHCGNGGCMRPIYRGRVCYRCWAGIKWTSIVQRVANVSGHCPSYIGVPVGFTREQLIQWVIDNPPPTDMAIPSIDRIVSALGYVPGNIRWLERDRNSARHNWDVPAAHRRCPRCQTIKPLSTLHFDRRGEGKFSQYCRPCRRVYDAGWREARRAA